jgi:hypothetical protein
LNLIAQDFVKSIATFADTRTFLPHLLKSRRE